MKLHEVLKFVPDDTFDKVYQIFSNIPDEYMETTDDAEVWLNDQFEKQNIDVAVKSVPFPKQPTVNNAIGLGGGWFVPAQDKMIIELLPSFIKRITTDFDKVMRTIHSLFVHEKTHQQQFRASGNTPNIFSNVDWTSEERYLSSPHEIRAMAAEIISELNTQGYNADVVRKALLSGDHSVMLKSNRFAQFVQSKVSRKVINRLYKILIQMLS
jgi:hypothetical protein